MSDKKIQSSSSGPNLESSRASNSGIPHSCPNFGDQDFLSIQSVLESRYLAYGPVTKQFEQTIGSFLSQPYARAVASGTSALELALLSLVPENHFTRIEEISGFFKGRKVLIPAYVCTGVLYAVEWVGAKPVYVDIDEQTWCVDPERMAEEADSKTIAAIPAYLFGHPGGERLPECDFVWIEDIAQAIGAGERGIPAGSLGHYAICSFYATKVITTGTGGMVLTGNEEAARRIDRLLQYDCQSDSGLHLSLEMGDFQAALGLSQWNQIENKIQKRREIAEIYTKGLMSEAIIDGLPTSFPEKGELVPGHIYYRYPIRLKRGLDQFITLMNQKGIEVKRPVFIPPYRLRGEDPGQFPNTERVFQTTASLPIYPGLTESDIARILDMTKEVLKKL